MYWVSEVSVFIPEHGTSSTETSVLVNNECEVCYMPDEIADTGKILGFPFQALFVCSVLEVLIHFHFSFIYVLVGCLVHICKLICQLFWACWPVAVYWFALRKLSKAHSSDVLVFPPQCPLKIKEVKNTHSMSTISVCISLQSFTVG